MDKLKHVEAQLQTIQAIVPFTIKIYENTQSIDAISTNLDMIEKAIYALRTLDVEEYDNDLLPIVPAGSSVEIVENDEGIYFLSLCNLEAKAEVSNKELFGELANTGKYFDITLKIPVTCGEAHSIKQVNPALALYAGDVNIHQSPDGEWYKESLYTVENTDILEYSLLIPGGRNIITIEVDGNLVYQINSHVHFVS